MNSECLRIADQLRRAFRADAWHGPSVLDLLAEVTPEQAGFRPMPSTHNILELVMHIDFWLRAAVDAAQGVPMPKLDGTQGVAAGDWPAVGDSGAVAWFDTQDRLFQNAEKLAQAIEGFDDAKLKNTVPGRPYDFYHLFHGIVQHSLYHAGQIAMLKKAMSAG
jgi:hypothetical protein